jgi:orotidine-5'-phosphate decarboxylase
MLTAAERQNHSMLCVGLDPEPTKFPGKLKGDANKIYDFCAAIVDATADLVISFKPQIAYFAAHRAEGQLERLMEHMRRVAPQVPIILDAKRGDIGSTAEQYAKEAFERYGADAVTLSPFMGFDSVAPYLQYEGKGAFCCAAPPTPAAMICRTSALPLSKASRCCMNTWRAWRRGRGTSMASLAWWWGRLTRRRLSVCVLWRLLCRC